jgi:hypothetical protein
MTSARFRTIPGRTTTVVLRLTRRGMRMVRRWGRLIVRADARARDAAGNEGTSAFGFWLKAPPR